MMITRICLAILLIIGIVFAYDTLKPSDGTCSGISDKPPEITVSDTDNEIAYDVKTSKKYLRNIQQDHERRVSRFVKFGETLGLTLATYEYNLSISSGFKKTSIFGDNFCPSIRTVDLKFDYTPKIYIAKEHASNRCAFNVILAHEMDHHQVNLKNKTKYMSWLKNDLPNVIGELSTGYQPVSQNGVQQMSERIERDIKQSIDTYVNKMHADTATENEKLDTKMEYIRLNREIIKCYRQK